MRSPREGPVVILRKVAGDSDETEYRQGEAPEGAAPDEIPKVGAVIADKYRVERILGIGGMGVVVAVTHLQLGEPYALKCLLPRTARNPETVARFLREARAAVRIKSEHIARVSDVGTLDNGSPYILMEYLTGRDLSDVLHDHHRLSIGDAVEYVLQACAGIAEAHALGIVHRDLKPSNLFLTQRLDGAPLVKVLDFGISKATDEGGPHAPSLTQTASVFGSPAYMSPEQVRSAKNVDVRTDIWALGVILHELLAGETPFVAETSSGLLAAIVADEPTPLRDRRPDVSEALDAVVRRCLQKDVKKRFQTVSELATALEPFRSDDSVVSIGRIRRLSAPPSEPLALLAAGASTSTRHSGADHAAAATDHPWTSGVFRPKRGRAVVALVIGVGAAAATFALVYLRTAPAPVKEPPASPARAEATSGAPPPSAPTTPAEDTSAAPSASVTASASAGASVRPRLVPVARPRSPARGVGSAATAAASSKPEIPGAVPPQVPVPSPGASVDPFSSSH
jgi:serine/threonine-protein kinase